MGMKTYISASVAAGDIIANTTAKTRFDFKMNMPPTSTASTVNGAFDLRYGQSFDVDLIGVISTTATPGTLTITVDHGGGLDGTTLKVLGTTGAITPPASLASAHWVLKGRAVYNTTGTAGIATFTGYFEITKADGSTVRYPMIATGSGTTGMATAVNTAQAPFNILGAAVQWATADAGNTITLAAGSMFGRRT